MDQPQKTAEALLLFFDIDHNEFVVHLKNEDWLSGTVYVIERYKKLTTAVEGWSYLDENNNMTDDVSKARIGFTFLYCWRGVWEGRIYFRQDEYWAEDLPVINALWIQIEPQLKQIIKAKDPDNRYDD